MMLQMPKEAKNKATLEVLVNMILKEVEKGGAEIRELDFNHTFIDNNKLEVNVRLVLEDR